MEPHKASLVELFASLEATAQGLSSDDARERLLRDGPNVLTVRKETPLLTKFLRQFKNFFAMLLIVGGALALLAERLDPGEGNLYIAIALFAVVFLNALFTFIQQHQSDRILASFQKMLPQVAAVLRDGREQRVAARDLVVGDILLLEEGDRVSVDGRLIEHHRLKVDLSSLTGESEPRLRHLECTHDNLLESRNMVFSGTLVQSGRGRAVVVATGMSTQIGRIVELTEETEEVVTPIGAELTRFVRIISIIAIALGSLFFALSVVMGKGLIASLIFAVGIIVANVPEGLLPTVTLALTMASRRMAHRNALIRNLESVETLGSTTVICSDKTGTLTQNRMHMSTVRVAGHEYAAWDPEARTDPALAMVREISTLCNNATVAGDGYAGDPTETALLAFAATLGGEDLTGRSRLLEEPFDSATKRMLTLYARVDDQGYRAYAKGAPEVVLEFCDRLLRDGVIVPMTDSDRAAVERAYRRLAMRGERVLALAWNDVDIDHIPEDGYIFVGVVGMSDPPRPEVADAIERCRSAGIRVIMVTGDYALTAESLARQIGLFGAGGRVVSGSELAAMSDDELAAVLVEPELVFARTTPAQKLRIVQALQALGEVVTVTGDGVNDAPALKNADMGVAMGVIGTEVAKEAADMVLLDDNFATIVAAVEEGRTIFSNIRKFVAYILTSNVPEILPFIAFVLLDVPLPLTVVLILAIDLGTDVLPALGLGAEPPESDVMAQPPRKRSDRLLTSNLLFISYGLIGVVQAAAGFFAFFVVLTNGGWTFGESLPTHDPLYQTAVTAFFAAIIVCQIADVMICRTRRASILSAGVLSNRLILVGIASEIVLLGLIVYVPHLNAVLGTAPLQAWHFLLGVPFAVFIVLADELRRYFVRRGSPFVLRYLTW